MKTRNTITFLTLLFCVPMLGSPIEDVIESKADLEALGAKLEITVAKGTGPDDPGSAYFKVDWPSTKLAPDIRKRMLSLLIFDPAHKDILRPTGTRFTIQLGEGRDRQVPIRAEFRASEAELETTVLAFLQGGEGEFGWQTVHYLILGKAVKGFPARLDPFEPSKEPVSPK